MLNPSWRWWLYLIVSLCKTMARASDFLGLLLWSFWSTYQASLAEYVAKMTPVADGQGHLSGKEGQHTISGANTLQVANPHSTCMKTPSMDCRPNRLS